MVLSVALLSTACFEETPEIPPVPVETTGLFTDDPLFMIELEPEDTLVSAPLLTAEAIILHTKQTLTAYDRDTGEPLWQSIWQTLQTEPVPLALTDDYIVSTAGDDDVTVFERSNGQVTRTVDTGSFITALAATNDTLTYATVEGDIMALSLDTGRTNWTLSKPTEEGIEINKRGAFNYINSSDGVAFIEAASGDVRWTIKMWDKGGTVALDPLRDVIYVAAIMPDQTLHVLAISLLNQSLLWDAAIPDTDTTIRAQLAASETRLFEASEQQGRLMAIETDGGGIEWLSPSMYGTPSAPVATTSSVYVRDAQMVYAFAGADGSVLGTLPIQDGEPLIELVPAADNDLIVVPTSFTQLQVYAAPQ